MIDSEVLAFTAIAAVLALTPGADTMLVIKNTIRGGQSAGLITTLGILSGTLLHALISAVGLSVILAQSAFLFHLIQTAGAVYLIWLGGKVLRSIRTQALSVIISPGKAQQDSYWEGLITNVLNPKVAIFYIAFLPQFISAGDPVLAKSVLLACIHNALSLLWLGGLAMAISSGRRWIEQPPVQVWLSGISGVILIGLGVRLMLGNR